MRGGARRLTCWNDSAVLRVAIGSIERTTRWANCFAPCTYAITARFRIFAAPCTVCSNAGNPSMPCSAKSARNTARKARPPDQELIATSGALTILTDCVMARNTQRLQRAVERESQRTAPRYCIEVLRGIGPVGHRHINFRGTYRPAERYADRLVVSAA